MGHCILNREWKHLSGLQPADQHFGCPDRVNVLLRVDVFIAALLQDWRIGPSGTPVALETTFGWFLAGGADLCSSTSHVASHHTMLLSGDDHLWEIEEYSTDKPILFAEEYRTLQHFNSHDHCTDDGRFVVSLPRKPTSNPQESLGHKPLGDLSPSSVCYARQASLKSSVMSWKST